MIILFSFCDIHPLFTWLIPFLLGLGLGWLLWGKFKAMVRDLEASISQHLLKIKSLEADLEACKKLRMEAEGNVSLLKGKIKELELNVSGPATNVTVPATAITTTNVAAESGDKWFAAIGNDKLQIIEGIGPKMEEVLNENGISSFASLAAASGSQLREILNKYGDKYRIIDPNTWPQQAKLAQDRQWQPLIQLQKTLDTGRSDTATMGSTDSKLEKWLIKAGVIRRYEQDDLKAVEGIGPKIEQLLHQAGIKTWRVLSTTSVESIKEILSNAGPKFSLADPATWPKQAQMAADGLWDELQTYQDFLNKGKEK